jgi:hypothetical protein
MKQLLSGYTQDALRQRYRRISKGGGGLGGGNRGIERRGGCNRGIQKPVHVGAPLRYRFDTGWYDGTITKFDEKTKNYTVKFDDGEEVQTKIPHVNVELKPKTKKRIEGQLLAKLATGRLRGPRGPIDTKNRTRRRTEWTSEKDSILMTAHRKWGAKFYDNSEMRKLLPDCPSADALRQRYDKIAGKGGGGNKARQEQGSGKRPVEDDSGDNHLSAEESGSWNGGKRKRGRPPRKQGDEVDRSTRSLARCRKVRWFRQYFILMLY